jgi:hypothetical protein
LGSRLENGTSGDARAGEIILKIHLNVKSG